MAGDEPCGCSGPTSAHTEISVTLHPCTSTIVFLLNPNPCRHMLSPKWQSGHRVCVLSETAALSKAVALSCVTQLPGQSPPAPPPKRPMAHGSNQRRWLSVGSTEDQRADPSVRVTGYRAPHQVPCGASGTHGDSLSVTTGSHIYE